MDRGEGRRLTRRRSRSKFDEAGLQRFGQQARSKAKGSWAEEVPCIVWAYHTTEQSGTHETPFKLVYGCDAMIPVEIQESSPRFQNFVAEDSNEERRLNLDLLDEVREG